MREPLDIERFRERFREAVGGKRNVSKFAATHGFAGRSLLNYFNGTTVPDIETLMAIASAANKDPAWFFGWDQTPSPEPGATVTIHEVNLEAAAGTSHFVDQVERVSSFEFPRAFLDKLGANARHVECLRVKGDSMRPLIEPGALLMIDTSEAAKAFPRVRSEAARRKTSAPIFVFVHGSMGYRVKRIETLDERWAALVSENGTEFPVELIDRQKSLKIVGKVVWWDNRL